MERQHKVIMFSTPTCSYCRTAKQYFIQKKIRFKEIDVSRDQRAAKDIQRRTGQQGVPVIVIDNKPIVGFDKNKINRYLGIN